MAFGAKVEKLSPGVKVLVVVEALVVEVASSAVAIAAKPASREIFLNCIFLKCMKGGKSECNSLIGGTNNKFDDFLFQEKQKIKKY